jgi:D-alanyl-D-alanine carboxypeptidase (penicillin-binding protein 5/6)
VSLPQTGPISIFVPITNRDRLIARIVYEGPGRSRPWKRARRIGTLKVWIGDT